MSQLTFLRIAPLLLCPSVSFFNYAEPISLYGRANVSFQLADEGDGRFTEVSSNASRLGVKGNLDLDSGLTALYQLEWEIDIANLSSSGNIKARDQYLGLRGDFGTVYLGRKNTYTKTYSARVDLFSDYQGDIKNIWKGENRLSESLSYETTNFHGFQLGINYLAEGSETGEDGVSVGLRYGDLQLKNSNWNATLTADSNINGYDTQRASVQAKSGNWLVSGMLHRQTKRAEDDSASGFLLSAQYGFDDWKLKTQYQSLEDDHAVTFGADYQLGRSTKTYIWYTLHSLDDKPDKTWLALGVEHRFRQ